MSRSNRRLCLIAIFMASACACVRALSGPQVWSSGDDAQTGYVYLLNYLIAVWIVSDPKLPESRRPSFDHALLHMVFLPFFAAYELFITRRWKGVAIALGLFLLTLVPTVLAVARS